MLSTEHKSRVVSIYVLEEQNISMNTTLENIQITCVLGTQWGSALTDPHTKKPKFCSGWSACAL